MLEWFAFLALGWAAPASPADFRCRQPEGTLVPMVQVLEASDVEEWSALDEDARRDAGDRTLRICLRSGCRDTSNCQPFTGPEGWGYQRLGTFRFLPKATGRPARVLLLGWNEADAGEHARSRGGANLYELAPDGAPFLKLGTISVTEQSQVAIVDDSLLAIADFVWGKGETRYARHRFQIRVWRLGGDAPVGTGPVGSFRTRKRHPSLDEVDTLDVVGQELSAIRKAAGIRGAR